MGMLSKLIGMATKAMSSQNSSRSGYGARGGYGSSGSKAQMARRVGDEVLNQVRKQGPDAAQRHLSKTRFGSDPRAQKAAKTADDLARRFAGTDKTPGTANWSGGDYRRGTDGPGGTRQNQWGERH